MFTNLLGKINGILLLFVYLCFLMVSRRCYDTHSTIQECKSHYFFIFLYSACFLSLRVLIPLEGWKQSQFHTLFPGIAAKFQGTKCEGIECEYWFVFWGIWVTCQCPFLCPSTYWNKMVIYPFVLGPLSLKDKGQQDVKMSRRGFPFWQLPLPFLRPPLGTGVTRLLCDKPALGRDCEAELPSA